MDAVVREVEIAAAQRLELAVAKPGVDRGRPQRLVAGLERLDQPARLVGGGDAVALAV
jgi:hypothetical protein